MPIILPEQSIKDALDVSGAFDNCFFHAYALHLLANNLPLPADLFTFESILGEDSFAKKLRKFFPDHQAFSIFNEYWKRAHPSQEPVSPHFIVEKTLVLGFILREWFATQLIQSSNAQDQLTLDAISAFQSYKGFRESIECAELLGSERGVLYTANLDFLEYFVARPKAQLTEEESDFEKYFRDNDNDEEKALTAYWYAAGYFNYCRQCALPNNKLSYKDISPVMELNAQAVIIYSSRGEVIHEIPANAGSAQMALVLNEGEGHYHLVKTELSADLLAEYQASYDQYKKDRATILASEEDRFTLSSTMPSLLVGAICPAEHLADPFTLLWQKLDDMSQFLVDYEQNVRIAKARSQINTALFSLELQVSQIPSHFALAANTALQLLQELQNTQDEYFRQLNFADNNTITLSQEFIKNCIGLIDTAKPVLERDLAWGDYLQNVIKKIANALIWLASVGNIHSFFTPKRSALVQAFEKTQDVLQGLAIKDIEAEPIPEAANLSNS